MAALQGSNVIVPDRMKLERLLRMKGGNEETSYANNSQAQVNYHFFLSIYNDALNL